MTLDLLLYVFGTILFLHGTGIPVVMNCRTRTDDQTGRTA
ncbi:hypothetical protein [Morganella morganii IS15]|nr:hypothetical protein [Morganella morganii IS15]